MRVLYFLFVCVSLHGYGNGDSASFITPCRPTDSACLKSSAQKAIPVIAAGVPGLGVDTLDPMLLGRVTTSQAGLEMDFRNTVVKGLRNCVVESSKRKENKTYLDLLCSVILTGDYTLGGKLLILPIEGKGKYKIKIRDIQVKISFYISKNVVDGESYWKTQNWQYTTDVKTRAEYNFDNLFNGNKQLADSVHNFATENWKDVFQEVAPPIVDAIVSKIIEQIKKLFEKVPESKLTLP